MIWNNFPNEPGIFARHLLGRDYEIVRVFRDEQGLYFDHSSYGRCRIDGMGWGRFMKLPYDDEENSFEIDTRFKELDKRITKLEKQK